MKEIYLVSPRGFCGGVRRAVTILDEVLKKHGSPVYVKHHLLHNKHIIADFKKKGVIFIEEMADIPNESVMVISAHGSSPDVYNQAKEKKLIVYDATCPLVIKVHLEAKRYEKEGYFIIYIGHKNHPEPKGVLGEVKKDSFVLVQNLQEAIKVTPPQEKKIVILSQTTLSFDETKKTIAVLKKRFPDLLLPPVFDICYATQNRQRAVKELSKKVNLILVIGSKESSNSNRLKEVGEKKGVKSYLINDVSKIKKEWIEKTETIGVTAGASAPDYLVDEVIDFFKRKGASIKKLEVIKENISFPLPANLKQNNI